MWAAAGVSFERRNLMKFTKHLWVPIAVGLVAAAGCSTSAPTPSPGDDLDVALSPSVIAQMESLIAEKSARTPAQRKIDSSLLYARSGRFNTTLAGGKDPAKQIKSLHQIDAQGRYLVDLKANMSALRGRIESLGGAIVDAGPSHARAWLGLDHLEDLAAEPAVAWIHPAFQAMTWRTDKPGNHPKWRTGTRAERVAAVQAAQAACPAPSATVPEPATSLAGASIGTGTGTANVGAKTSEGDKAHAADRARKCFGIDGTGIKVGVLSDSDDFKDQAIASGDLPASTTTIPDQDGRPGAGEGTAMMEIVHDLAPGADLVFATAFNGPESFADNIRRLRFEFHCDVIVDDVIYFAESPYQDDIIAQAVADVTADGAMYFSSAGNGGNFDDGTSGTWEGDFKPAGALATLPSGYTVHSFGNGVIANRIELDGGPLILHWADPSTIDEPLSSNDYDLFVLDNDLRDVLLASTNIQAGHELPFEPLGFLIPAGFRVVIAANPGAETRALRTVIFNGEYAISTSGSTYGHNSAADAYGVAAVDAAEADGGEFIAGPTTPVELFSSDGPRRIFWDRNSQPINPAKPIPTFASGGGVSRAKPDIAAADGVVTTLPPGSGLNPFFGTSAAAPHAGAIAALLKAAGFSPSQIRAAIVASALDIEATGPDRDSGRGIVSAFNALQKAGAKAAVVLDAGAPTVTPLGGGTALVPGSTALMNVALTNSGCANATAVTSALTSSSPDVFIIPLGTSAYPNIASGGGSATNTTPFAFFVQPTVPCGAQLPFSLAVTYTNAATRAVQTRTFGFLVQTGRPGAPMHFAYTGPVVPIPDNDPAGVDVAIPVTFSAGPIAKLALNIDGTACSAAVGSTTVGVDHTWVGDLTFKLTSPGTSVRSVTVIDAAGGPGNSGNNFCQTILDDAGTSSIQTVPATQAPFGGTFKPASPLSAFTGADANGTWTLHVTDNAFLDTGNVRAFSIDVSGFTCAP
jgi:subtilisin-like proprotein convertase family protein